MKHLILFLVLLASWFSNPSKDVHAAVRYKKGNYDQLLKEAHKKYIAQETQKNPEIKKYKRAKASAEKSLRKARCTKIKLKVKVKVKIKAKVWKSKMKVQIKNYKVCIQGDRKNNPVITIDGKKNKLSSTLAKAGKKSIDGLKKEFNKAKKNLEKAKKGLVSIGKKIKKKADKIFSKALKKKLKQFAVSLARGMAVQIAFLIKKQAVKYMSKGAAKASSWMAQKFPKLAKTSSKSTVQAQVKTSSGFSKALKTTGKTALLSAALAVASESASIILKCWNYGKAAKRRCLQTNIAKGMSNAVYYTVVNMIWFAADGMIIDPLAISLAASVTAAAAVATAGPGALLGPLAYVVASAVMNGAVFAALEVGVKPKWDGLYNQYAKSKAETAAKNMISKMSDNSLKCFSSPASKCKYD